MCQAKSKSSFPEGKFNLTGESGVKRTMPVRSAKTGKYVKKEEAKKHPATTVTEKDKKKK